MYPFLKKFLFALEPEIAHALIKKSSQVFPKALLRRVTAVSSDRLKISLGKAKLANPIGLAAGFDKNGELLDLAASLSFGYLEVGSVTAKAYEGNPTPRIFRLPKDESLINRLGLPNWGVDRILKQLKTAKKSLPIGINIAKTPGAPNGVDDMMTSLQKIYRQGSYLVFNLSCPNTKDGKTFEDPKVFKKLSKEVMSFKKDKHINKPFLIKLSPNLDKVSLKTLVEQACQDGFDGFVVSNTTSHRVGLQTGQRRIEKIGPGGLSGKALTAMANQQLKEVYHIVGQDKILIGVGGLMDFKDLVTKLSLGARYFQIYTGLIYRGPFFVRKLARDLVKLCRQMGVSHYSELIGQSEIVKSISS